MPRANGMGPLVGLVWLTAVSWACGQLEEGRVKVVVVPDQIKIGSFYRGTVVTVSARTPHCDSAVITLEGKDEQLTLNRKEKLGIIWLNASHLVVRNAPVVYMLAASDRLTNICSTELQQRLGLGLEALRRRVKFETTKSVTGGEFAEFLKLKEHNGTYNTHLNVDMRPAGGTGKELSADLPLSSVAPVGEYRIRLFCFERGTLVQTSSADLSIEEVGLPHVMRTLAFKKPVLYGILAVVVAMATGIVVGIMFSSRARGGH